VGTTDIDDKIDKNKSLRINTKNCILLVFIYEDDSLYQNKILSFEILLIQRNFLFPLA